MLLRHTELKICKSTALLRQAGERDRYSELEGYKSIALLRQAGERYRYSELEGYKSVTPLGRAGIARRHRQIEKSYYRQEETVGLKKESRIQRTKFGARGAISSRRYG